MQQVFLVVNNQKLSNNLLRSLTLFPKGSIPFLIAAWHLFVTAAECAPTNSMFTPAKTCGGDTMQSAKAVGSDCWGESPAKSSCSPFKNSQLPVIGKISTCDVVAGCSTSPKGLQSKGEVREF